MDLVKEALDDPSVTEAKEAIQAEKRRKRELQEQIEEAEAEVEELKDELVDVRADRSIGDASADDVDAKRDELQAAKMRVSDLQDEHEASARAIEKLEDRHRTRRMHALSERKWTAKAGYLDALKNALSAVETAQEALDEAAEAGDKVARPEFKEIGFDSPLLPGGIQNDRELRVTTDQGTPIQDDPVSAFRTAISELERQIESDEVKP
jgi:DNA repair exonuclease SbcCD ATPase subunit